MVQKMSDTPSKPRRGRPREYDPDRALASATRVFWKNGYAATSLDELAAATGMNRPSLYAGFGDKRELYLETLKRYRERTRAGVAQLRIELKYNEGEPVIKEIHRVSKPGRRVYSKIKELQRVYAGLGISILSTPRGVLSDAEARAANVGGEVLARVF